jgi:hypothetical protein
VSEPAPDDVGRPTRRRPSRRVKIGIALGVVALLGAAVGVGVYLWQRSDARPVSVEEAKQRLDGQGGDGSSGGAFLPAEGVYRYQGSGTESLSTPPKSQDEGPELPATVRHDGDGCWTFRIDYSTNHWQDWHYCATDTGLVERGGDTFQRWDFVVSAIENTSKFVCDPPNVVVRAGATPGATWQQSCDGTNSQVGGATLSSGPMRFVGVDRLQIGTREVQALHYVQHRTISGAQRGVNDSDLWFATNGLPLRNRRAIEVSSDSPIGSITYTEDGSFTLSSLRPVDAGRPGAP